jgi:glycosyltransferase involved in cell wall biosynthesis
VLAEVPVVARAVGGLPEVVGEGGILIAGADPASVATPLGDLAAQPDERKRLGTAGRRRALERFTPDEMVRSFEALYEELASGA